MQKSEPLASVRQTHRQVLEDLQIEMRRRGYSIRTEQAYTSWVCRYLAFHVGRDLHALRQEAVSSFLQDLAVRGKVAASTKNQALNALVFFYGQVLKEPIAELDRLPRAKRFRKLQVVLTRPEMTNLIDRPDGAFKLMAELLYGTGMRLMECLCRGW